ncbi:MAG TPA: D-alanine--D-alanine ligase family protein [Acidimicrobiales bacterium]|nr:D-alanine--D-alanine ligase family protein [Acidimicrobiales bacterium]
MPSQQPGPKTRLIVIYGGRSAEHEVSCISALHVVRAVDPARYDVKVVGITTGGRWIDVPSTALDASLGEVTSLPSPDTIEGSTVSLREPAGRGLEAMVELASGVGPPGAGTVSTASTGEDAERVVVLPLLHGPMGEDGTVQGLLEVADVPYCGPGVAGSAAAMDKGLTKALLASAGLPQARHLLVREGEVDRHLADRVGSELGWPVFVKPANMGSSIGITRVGDADLLLDAIDVAMHYDEYVVIEEAVAGARELEIGVLGWPDLRTSVPGEIEPSRDFYDFEDKYLEGAAGLEVPAQIPDDVASEMSRLAIAACKALRVDSMARVDFFWEHPGRGLLINEVNTIPGFTPISMYPRMWAASGVPYADLVDKLVDQALRRAERRSRFDVRRT